MEHTNMENTGCYHGGMVAFEGPADIVSTQLRLLPPSSQVLILPDLEHYMKREEEKKFTVRSYVKDIHEAAQARHEAALQFLGDSNRGNKRLVFLNGGTAGAVSQCISAISHHKTSGNSLHAELILREVLREGVQGLDREEPDCNDLVVRGSESVCTREACAWEEDEIEEDPITRAMKAADALYRETESLEPIECYIRTRPRSLSYPVPGWMDNAGQSSPFFVFGSPPNEETQPESRFESDAHYEDNGNSPRRRTMRVSTQCSEMTIPMAYRPSSSMGRSFKTRSIASMCHTRNQSSTSNTLLSPPMSPSEVEFGEARLVQMHASRKSAQPLRRSRSLDDMELHRTRMRRRVVSTPPPRVREITSPPATSDIKSPCRHLSIMEDPFSNHNLIRLPQAKFVRANTTTIRKSPTFSRPPYSTTNHPLADVADVADEDTKSEPRHMNEEDHDEIVLDPVLPFHEDLVIQFTGEVPNPILDSVIGSLQNGLYPVSTLPLDCDDTADTESCPSTPRTADLFDVNDFHGGLSPVVEVPSIDGSVDCDAKSTGGFSRASNFRFQSPCPSLPPEVQPPTPAHTPPIMGTDVDGKRSRFQLVSTIDRVNAIAIQNNLRSILDTQFPPEHDRRYRMSRFSLLPQMDKIWRPIFWNVGSKGRVPSERTTDLILAIGAQNSVKTEFVSALTGQIEKLGSKSTGMTRSGRLDLRFLVANAMQSFTTQSLATQLQGNPFDSPHLLACLIVPHLATYLSVNASTRFLILEYPAEHLATVVALQNLIGVDILKIAGVIDSEAASAYNTEPSSPVNSFHGSRLSGDSMTNSSTAQLVRSLDAISLPGSPFPHQFPLQSPFGSGPTTLAQRRRLSFSKANYVLTNTATEAEISSFISIIWRILIQADAFYTPEHSAFMAARTTLRYPTTKISNGSLVSSKFAPASTAPSTPATTTPGMSSTVLNHPCYPHWGLSGSLASPPSSRGSGVGTELPSSFSRHTLPRSVDHEYNLYSPPLVPVPQPPSSIWCRDESPSGVSLRSVQSRGRLGMDKSGLAITPTSGPARKASVSPSPVADDEATGLAASVTSPAVGVGAGAGAGAGAIAAGGFLRSKSLNRILASRRGRKASGGAPMSLHDPVPASPGVGGIETTPPVPAIPTTKRTSAIGGGGGGGGRDSILGRPPLHLEVHVHGRDSLLMAGHDNKLMANNGDATSAYAMSIVDEGEFYDDEERRLMPMYMRQSEIRKGNSRKALKWLGLA